LLGAVVVEIEPREDSRGVFARTWCEREFAAHGLPAHFVQASISVNRHRGTVRGMHLQLPPSREGKLVRCTRGGILDVIIDLRPDSPTFMQHYGIELSASAHSALYVPPLMAHGFQTLADDSEVLYQMTDFYDAGLGFGVRWNDPVFGIHWPQMQDVVILARDADYPDFDSGDFLRRCRTPIA
jgi:dTDP-4-dehydrorhamnose 3,5-epimerase